MLVSTDTQASLTAHCLWSGVKMQRCLALRWIVMPSGLPWAFLAVSRFTFIIVVTDHLLI